MEHNEGAEQEQELESALEEVDTSPELIAALAKLSAVGSGGDPAAILSQALEDLGRRINTEDIVIAYDDDGKVKPVDALMGSGWIIQIYPLNWEQQKQYKLRDHEVIDWEDSDKIRLIYENLYHPDFRGESGAKSLEEFEEWCGQRLGWADVDDLAHTIVKFSHSRMRRLKLVRDDDEGLEGKESTPSDSQNGSPNDISTA